MLSAVPMQGRSRVITWVNIWLIACVLVLVPTLVRAQQHVDGRHDPIRQSVRLNWNGDAPPVKADAAAPAADWTDVQDDSIADRTERSPLLHPVVPVEDALPGTPLLDAPDALRGPPLSILIAS